jgi:ABC-type sugar transport system ATPase subunit
MAEATGQRIALQVEGVSKAFDFTQALDDVSMMFPRGTITGLLGQNGSGKSTLIKILAGFHTPDAASAIRVHGEVLPIPVKPQDVRRAGMHFLHQDLGLVPELTIADNLAFTEGFGSPLLGLIKPRAEERRVQKVLSRFAIRGRPETLVASLSPTERTMVAIARVFQSEGRGERSRILFLDEPTASLPASETQRVFAALRSARDAGGTIVYVTHRLDEVLELADRVIVLRDGKVIAEQDLSDLGVGDLITMIVGRAVERGFPRAGEVRAHVTLRVDAIQARRLDGVGVLVRSGEIFGVTGLQGCGRSELARVIAGAQPPKGGAVYVDGDLVPPGDLRSAIAAGVAYVPADRRTSGCIPLMSVRQNITLGDLSTFWRYGWLQDGRERTEVARLMKHYDIRPPRGERPVGTLSGGNQQKVVVAKHLRLKPKLLILDEPTQGVDVAGRRDIGVMICDLADQGVAVVLCSSDFDELVQLCDRVLVLDRGRAVATVTRDELSEERLTLLCTEVPEEVTT